MRQQLRCYYGASILLFLLVSLTGCGAALSGRSLEESVQVGQFKMARGDYKGAEEAFNIALQTDPTNAQILITRGLALAQQGKLLMAIADYDLALQQQPDLQEAWTYRGNAHNQLFQWDQALADFSQAIALKPDNPAALSSRAITYYNLGQKDEAIADLKVAKNLLELANDTNHAAQVEQLLRDYEADPSSSN